MAASLLGGGGAAPSGGAGRTGDAPAAAGSGAPLLAEAILSAAYRAWRVTRTLPPVEGGTGRALDALGDECLSDEKLYAKDALECVFLAELAESVQRHALAAHCYVAAYRGRYAARGCQEFDDVDAACELAGLDCLAAIVDAPSIADACSRVERALASRQCAVDAMLRAMPAAPAPAPAHRVAELDVASYLFNRVMPSLGDYYKLQKAMFWANAEWTRRHGYPMIDKQPLRWKNGPVYRDTYDAIPAWPKPVAASPSPRDESNVTDSEMRSVLNQAAAYVRAKAWEVVCDETHAEPVWLVTAADAPITDELMKLSYGGGGDPTGMLAKIFPSS